MNKCLIKFDITPFKQRIDLNSLFYLFYLINDILNIYKQDVFFRHFWLKLFHFIKLKIFKDRT